MVNPTSKSVDFDPPSRGGQIVNLYLSLPPLTMPAFYGAGFTQSLYDIKIM